MGNCGVHKDDKNPQMVSFRPETHWRKNLKKKKDLLIKLKLVFMQFDIVKMKLYKYYPNP